MIETIKLIRNIGQFDSVGTGQQLPLGRTALIYGENGRGKTTLAAILRSLGTGNPAPILERHRLGAANPPHVVVAANGNAVIFQNGAWQQTCGEILIFDDVFVSENICSGTEVDADHRQNLHELIIGRQGVALNAAVQAQIDQIEVHNREITRLTNAIPDARRGALTIDQFCALEFRADVNEAIETAERALAAGRQSDEIQRYEVFDPITLPEIDLGSIEEVLGRQLRDLEASAVQRVQQHLSSIGPDGEGWVASGMQRIEGEDCPFCAQSLQASPLIAHYQAYFSQEYRSLIGDIDRAIRAHSEAHSGDVPAAFERAVAQTVETKNFWARFTPIEPLVIDTASIALAWREAFRAVFGILQRKNTSPLELVGLTDEVRNAVVNYRQRRGEVIRLCESLLAHNQAIRLVKERAAVANVRTLERDLRNLMVLRDRFSPDITIACDEYLAEKRAKTFTEQSRDAAREALNRYRATAFPGYQDSINEYLARLNASFRLGTFVSVNIRSGSSCNYTVLINAHEVPIVGAKATSPCFKNVMSAGDRNTLALAFFFATLERHPYRQQVTVIIDDPMTSLDEHRSLATVQEIRTMSGTVDQMVILSHSKPFLFAVWHGLDRTTRSAMRIVRAGQSSALASWDVTQDSVTENDRRHVLVTEYIASGASGNERQVAAALRPILEAFMRVAYPAQFPPESLLGPFIDLCQRREGRPDQVMSPANRAELRLLLDYANKFHHDTNPTWETAHINDQELLNFSTRTLTFATK